MIVDGFRSGGEIATLLEETAHDIRAMEILRKEIRANVMMYMIFIFMAAAVIGPILYAVSIHLVTMVADLSAAIDVPEEFVASLPFGIINVGGMSSIPATFLQYFAVTCLMITIFFGGMIIGLIETGKEKNGFKYIPILLASAMGLFFAARFLLETFFSNYSL